MTQSDLPIVPEELTILYRYEIRENIRMLGGVKTIWMLIADWSQNPENYALVQMK